MEFKFSKATILSAIIILAGIIIAVFSFGGNSSNAPSADNVSSVAPSSEERGSFQAPKTVEIDVVAEQFKFTPNPIRVKYGDRVVLNITSKDITHGFALPDFNINEVLNPGQTVRVEFIANKKGRFGFYCSVPCGAGHVGMRGNVIVE